MIVDTSALLAILFREPEHLDFRSVIFRAEVARLSVASYLEANVVVFRRRPDQAGELEDLVYRLSLVLEPVTIEHARAARDGFQRFGQTRHPARLNFGDCFAYALAATSREPLLFKGDDFSQTDIRSAL